MEADGLLDLSLQLQRKLQLMAKIRSNARTTAWNYITLLLVLAQTQQAFPGNQEDDMFLERCSTIYYLPPSDLGEIFKSIGQKYVPEAEQFMYNLKNSQSGVMAREILPKYIEDGPALVWQELSLVGPITYHWRMSWARD